MSKINQGPSIFVASNDAEAIAYVNAESGNNFVTIDQALDWVNNQGDYLVQNRDAGGIVTQDLKIYLDAGQVSSYPLGGSNWYDLSGNNFHMSLKNGVTFNSGDGVFELDGSDDYGVCDGSISGSVEASVTNLGIGGSSQKTVVCIAQIRPQGGTNAGLFDIGDTGVAGQHYSLRLRGSYGAFRAQFWSTPDYDFDYNGESGFTFYSVVYGSDKIGRTYGNNASLFGSDGSAYDLVTSGVRPFEMGRYGGANYFGGRVAAYLVYDRGLTTTEILQNYNALKGRFGL